MSQERLEEIDLNVTNRCNIACSHCLFAAGPEKGDDLSLGEITQVLEDGKKLGAHEVHISGGEPMVRKDFEQVLRIADRLDYFVRLQTNMWAFKPEMMPVILETADEVLTSLDGMESSHDLIRKPGSFQKTVDSVDRLMETGIRVVVITAVQRKNYQDIPELVEFLSDKGVDAHFLFSVTPLGRATNDDVVSPKEWESLTEKLYEIYQSRELKTDTVCELHHLRGNESITFNEAECRLYTRNHAIVLPNGKVFPCSMFITTDKSLGNIKDSSFEEIWNNSPVWNFYGSHIDDPSCNDCKLLALCKGGCPGYSYLLTGNITKHDPRCEPGMYPVCPSWKLNLRKATLSCSTWRVMKR